MMRWQRALGLMYVVAGSAAASGCGDDAQLRGPDAGLDAPPPDARPVDPRCGAGLAAWYRFDDAVGPVVDGCGRRNGMAEGAGVVRGRAGRVGAAITFDGTDGRVVIGADHELDFVTAGTVEYWIDVEDRVNPGAIVSRGTGDVDDNILQTTECGNIVTIYTRANTGLAVVASECDALPAAGWVHVAVVNDGVQARLYVNDALVKTSPGGFLGPLAHDLYIGRRQQGMFPFKGALDELMWWTVVRSPEQICGDAGGTWNAPACSF